MDDMLLYMSMPHSEVSKIPKGTPKLASNDNRRCHMYAITTRKTATDSSIRLLRLKRSTLNP